MDKVEAVVTGVGPVSPVGSGRDAFWDGLLEGRCGIRPISRCPRDEVPVGIAAEIPDFRLETYVQGGRLLAHKTPRTTQLALAAGVLALHDAEIDLDACDPDRFGVHVATSLGSLEMLVHLGEPAGGKQHWLDAHQAFHAHPHATACVISSFFNIRGPVQTSASGATAGLDALGQALRAIQAGAADAILAVGTDAQVTPPVLRALHAGGALATRFDETPGQASRPFDRGRAGAVAGEGAAALLIESEPHARARKARIYARLDAHAVCAAGRNRQFDPDAPELDVRPSVRALGAVLEEAGWTAAEVDLVNAHASSSMPWDQLEAMALAEVLGESRAQVPVTSIKGNVGQPGAAASALQAVATCLAIRRATLPPTRGWEHPDPRMPELKIVTQADLHAVRRVLVHAIGLGGFHASAAAFSAVASEETAKTGLMTVRWSAEGRPSFRPAGPFTKPLEPWAPRGGEPPAA